MRKNAYWLTLVIGTFLIGCFPSNPNNEGDRVLFGLSEQVESREPKINYTSQNGGFSVPENPANGTLIIDFSLNRPPLDDVSVPIELSPQNQGTISAGQLNFTTENWNTPQSVTVTGIDNQVQEGNREALLVLGNAVSEDKEYSDLVSDNIILTVIDDDTSSVVISPTQNVETYEDQTKPATTFTMVLSSQPTHDVSIPTLSSSDTTEGIPSPTGPIVFTPTNWNTPQTISIQGQDDNIYDGNITYFINFGNAESQDPNYNNMETSPLRVSNVDDDTPGIEITRLTGAGGYGSTTPLNLSFNEGDAVSNLNRFQVVLTRIPVENITISLTLSPSTSNITDRVTMDKSSLTFTPGDWNVPQVVTLTPNNNSIADDNISFKIITGQLPEVFGGFKPPDVDVTLVDDDTPGVQVVQLNRNVIEHSLQNAYFRLRLTSQPTANVTIPINDVFDSGAAGLIVKPASRMGTVDKTSVVFTPSNWDQYQNVTFNPVNDDVADTGGETKQFIIELQNCVSSDAKYNGLKPTPNITVNYSDNDTPGFVIVSNNKADETTSTTTTGKSAGTISGFATDDSANLNLDTYSRWTMKLRTQPLASVTVTLSLSSDQNDGVFDDNNLTTKTLTFSTTDWDTAQTVKIRGTSNGVNEGNRDYTVSVSNITGDANSYADKIIKYSNTAQVARPSFKIFSCDNDVSNEVTSCRRSGGFTTSEGGGTATVWFITKDNPGSNVCVPVESSDETEGIMTYGGDGAVSGTPSRAIARITTSNWNTMTSSSENRVVVTGQDDGSFDGNSSYTLNVFNPTCGDAKYTGFNPADIPIRNVDNEQALVFQNATHSHERDPATGSRRNGSFQVRIGMAPSPGTTVQFNLSCPASDKECSSLSPTSLTFDNANAWQTVTVIPVTDDDRADGTKPVPVNFSAFVSDDPVLNEISPPSASPINNEDKDKIIYISNGLNNPNFNSGMTVADNVCETDANKPSWGTYKALLGDNSTRRATQDGSTNAGQIGWILKNSTDYYRKDGGGPYTTRIFTTNSQGLFSFPLANAFSTNGADNFWTGFNTNLTTATNNCTDWTQNGTGGPPHETTFGVGNSISASSLNSAVSDCDTGTTKKLICVQQ